MAKIRVAVVAANSICRVELVRHCKMIADGSHVCVCVCECVCESVWVCTCKINRIAITVDQGYRISTAERYPYEWYFFNLTLTHHCVTRWMGLDQVRTACTVSTYELLFPICITWAYLSTLNVNNSCCFVDYIRQDEGLSFSFRFFCLLSICQMWMCAA